MLEDVHHKYRCRKPQYVGNETRVKVRPLVFVDTATVTSKHQQNQRALAIDSTNGHDDNHAVGTESSKLLILNSFVLDFMTAGESSISLT